MKFAKILVCVGVLGSGVVGQVTNPPKVDDGAAGGAAPVAAVLEVGSPAPALTIQQWVKGEPVDLASAKGKQIVVLEFWATWCGPCIQSIPHLSKLQRTYADKGVRVVGVTPEDPGNSLEMVRELVKKLGDKIGYGIAFDKGETADAYMAASGAEGIPTAFVITKSGHVGWFGHPDAGLDEVLEQMVGGTFDLELARKVAAVDRKLREAMSQEEVDWNRVLAHTDEVLTLKPNDIDRWMFRFAVNGQYRDDKVEAKKSGEMALKLASGNPTKLGQVASELLLDGDPLQFNDTVLIALDAARAAFPNDVDLRVANFNALMTLGKNADALKAAAETLDLMKGDVERLSRFAEALSSPPRRALCSDLALRAVDLAIQTEPESPRHYRTKFHILLECKNDIAGAAATGQYLIQKAAGDAMFLNEFAWVLLTEPPMMGKFNALALEAAELMYKAPGGDGWAQLDTYALAKFENGFVDEAIEIEKRAIDKSPSDRAQIRYALQAALRRFEDAKLGRK